MQNFHIYSNHLVSYSKQVSKYKKNPITILISGKYDAKLPAAIIETLGENNKIIFESQENISPNITIDFKGFTDNFWEVQPYGLYIPFIKYLSASFDYGSLTGDERFIEFVNCTGFIYQYDDFLVIEKRPTPNVMSGFVS